METVICHDFWILESISFYYFGLMTNVRVEQGQLAVALNPPQGGGLARSSFLYLNDNGRVDYQPVARFSADPGEHLRIQGINDPSDGDYLRKFDFSGLLPYPVLGWDIRGRSGKELDVFAVYNQTIPAYEGAAEETPFYLFTAHASGASVRNQATVVANSVINAAESQDLSKGTIMTLSAFATAGNDSGSESVIGMDNSTINFGDDSNSLMFLGGANREKEGPNNNTYGFTAMRDSVVNMGGGDDGVDVSAASNLVDEESFFTFKVVFQGKNTINGGAGFDVVEIHKPVDGFELTCNQAVSSNWLRRRRVHWSCSREWSRSGFLAVPMIRMTSLAWIRQIKMFPMWKIKRP